MNVVGFFNPTTIQAGDDAKMVRGQSGGEHDGNQVAVEGTRTGENSARLHENRRGGGKTKDLFLTTKYEWGRGSRDIGKGIEHHTRGNFPNTNKIQRGRGG